MKNFYQRLLETPVEHLDKMIRAQELQIETAQKELQWMKEARAKQVRHQDTVDLTSKLDDITRERQHQRQHQATCDMLAREDEFDSAHTHVT